MNSSARTLRSPARRTARPTPDRRSARCRPQPTGPPRCRASQDLPCRSAPFRSRHAANTISTLPPRSRTAAGLFLTPSFSASRRQSGPIRVPARPPLLPPVTRFYVALVDSSTRISRMATASEMELEGAALEAWRSYLQSHASILRELDAELVAEHGMTTRDYEVLLYLAQADDRRLPMSALAERTMLTRSGITRLIDGLVRGGLIERSACPSDARISYACLTDAGYERLRQAGCTHIPASGVSSWLTSAWTRWRTWPRCSVACPAQVLARAAARSTDG